MSKENIKENEKESEYRNKLMEVYKFIVENGLEKIHKTRMQDCIDKIRGVQDD